MEVVDRTEKRSNLVDLINPIVEEAFGRGFKGNYVNAHHSVVDGPEGLKETNRLAMIGRKRFLGFYCECAGQLGSEFGAEGDGSVIAVFPKYENAAKKYAELYKTKTGRDVKIILTDVINPCDRNVLTA